MMTDSSIHLSRMVIDVEVVLSSLVRILRVTAALVISCDF